MWTFEVDILRVGFDDVGCHIAGNIQQSLVVLNGILVVDRCIFELVFLYVIALLQVHNTLHEGVIEMKFNLRVITIVISHIFFVFGRS